jgi:hypothetical protein
MKNIYVGVEVFPSLFLREYVRLNNIPQAHEDRQLLHTTVLHSTNVVDKSKLRESKRVHVATPAGFTIFPYKDRQALALLLECTSLHARNSVLREAGLIDRHEIYKPHITLSYDIGDFDWKNLPAITCPIKLGHETIRSGGTRIFHRTPAWEALQQHLDKFMKGLDDRRLLGGASIQVPAT